MRWRWACSFLLPTTSGPVPPPSTDSQTGRGGLVGDSGACWRQPRALLGPSGRTAEWTVLPGAPGRRSALWPPLSVGPCPATCRIPAFCSSVRPGWAPSRSGSAPAPEPPALPPQPPLPITPFVCDAASGMACLPHPGSTCKPARPSSCRRARLGRWALCCLCVRPWRPSLDTEGMRRESRLMLLEYDHATSRRDCPLDTSAPFSVLTRPLHTGASGVVPFSLVTVPRHCCVVSVTEACRQSDVSVYILQHCPSFLKLLWILPIGGFSGVCSRGQARALPSLGPMSLQDACRQGLSRVTLSTGPEVSPEWRGTGLFSPPRSHSGS